MSFLADPVVLAVGVMATVCWMVLITLQFKRLLEWLEAINHAIEVVGLALKNQRR